MTAIEQRPATNPFGWPTWLWRLGLAATVLIFTVCLTHQVTAVARHFGLMSEGGEPGLTAAQSSKIPGSFQVTNITPNGPAASAGLQVGDLVSPSTLGGVVMYRAGEAVPLTVWRDGRHFRVEITVPPRAGREIGSNLTAATGDLLLGISAIGGMIAMGFGALLLIRGRRSRAAIILGLILVGLGGQNPIDSTWGPTFDAARLLFVLRFPALLSETYLWPVFCLEISRSEASKRERWMTHAVALALTTAQAVSSLSAWNAFSLYIPAALRVIAASVLLAQLFGLAIIVSNYRRNDAPTRNRIKVLVLAFLCFAAGLQVEIAFNQSAPYHGALMMLAFIVVSTLAAALLAYAVLKQQLFDIGFAINRTLVYGAVSFTLLAAFGLAEWGADRLVPEEWHKQSALYSAGIALLLFLSFHRVRDWFEKHVERVFFASWQRAEADLKRFVASAGHFRQAPALCRDFVTEVERFAQGAPAAMYLRDDDGGYVRQCGSLADAAASYVEEDRAFALLAAERAPVDLIEVHSTLPGAMAFPMFDQLGLAGFVLVGSREDGAHYRPDEIENLAWATQQMGLDLQALQARQLRAEVAALREQLASRRRRPPKLAAVSASITA